MVEPRGEHMRFTLTNDEREAVVALKKACEAYGVKYRSIFELAKYVLVVHSQANDTDPKAAEKRCQLALKRLTKRRQWEQTHGMDQIDNLAALKEIDAAHPGFFVVRYKTDCEGHNVVGHHMAYAPYKFMFDNPHNLGKYLAAEQYRLDVAAADLEEARKGIAVVSIADGLWGLTGAYRYLRVLTKARDNVNDMHPNRVRKVLSEIPIFGHHLIEAGKAMLPKKIAARVEVFHELDEMVEEKLCKAVPGKDAMDIMSWAIQRNAIYEESVRKVTL